MKRHINVSQSRSTRVEIGEGEQKKTIDMQFCKHEGRLQLVIESEDAIKIEHHKTENPESVVQ